MANEIQVIVCDDAAKAAEAQAFLQAPGRGFAIVLAEPAATFVYDAVTYDGGTNDNLGDKWVVIGRK